MSKTRLLYSLHKLTGYKGGRQMREVPETVHEFISCREIGFYFESTVEVITRKLK